MKRTHLPHRAAKVLLDNQTALITGSNSGIGLACAQLLPSLGVSHLIMAVRSVQKGEEAAAPIRLAHPDVIVEVWELDMLSYPSIMAFAKRCESLARLDVGILNAGVGPVMVSHVNRATGYEDIFQVNYLSTALLAILLLPILSPKTPQGAPGRLTIVGSCTSLHAAFRERCARPLFASLNTSFYGFMNGRERYATSKLLVLMFAHQLSRIVSSSDVVINVVDPGLTAGTNLQRKLRAEGRVLTKALNKLVGRTPEEAAWKYVDAVAVKGEESHGEFVMCGEVHSMLKILQSNHGKETMQTLWEETLSELHFAGVNQIFGRMGSQVAETDR